MAGYHATEELLEKNSVRRLILRLGISAMFGQFFNMLYSMVDRLFVGHITETGGIALASIGVCAPALTAVTAFAYMVGIGGASYMSISLGKKDSQRAKDILGNAFLLLMGIAVLVTAVLLAVRRPVLYLLGCSDVMYPYAEIYFTIYICGTAASLCGVGLNQFLLAQGLAKQGMIAVAMGAAVNVILDPLLIFVCGMGVAGAAAATVISQCCMAVYVLSRICAKNMPVRLGLCRFRWGLAVRIITIGSMSFLITLMDNLIIILLNVVLRRFGGASRGDQLITCAAVVQSFLAIVACPAQGITSGCGTIFSYNYGRRDYRKIREAFMGVFLLCGVYIGFLEICVQAFPQVYAGLFLREAVVLSQASSSLRMYTLVLLGIAVQYALVDGLTAMGKIRYAFPLSVFRKIVYVACIFCLPIAFDIRFVFYAGSISDAVGATFSLLLFFTVIRPKLKKELQ
ncbi:MAG: MATE family efflux transporter [Lachnospiraceae bacterium]|nr:MATE family efflux transporter [Lachnospiraceae bacterium]